MSLGLNTVEENLYWVFVYLYLKSTHDACIAGISIGIDSTAYTPDMPILQCLFEVLKFIISFFSLRYHWTIFDRSTFSSLSISRPFNTVSNVLNESKKTAIEFHFSLELSEFIIFGRALFLVSRPFLKSNWGAYKLPFVSKCRVTFHCWRHRGFAKK